MKVYEPEALYIHIVCCVYTVLYLSIFLCLLLLLRVIGLVHWNVYESETRGVKIHIARKKEKNFNRPHIIKYSLT